MTLGPSRHDKHRQVVTRIQTLINIGKKTRLRGGMLDLRHHDRDDVDAVRAQQVGHFLLRLQCLRLLRLLLFRAGFLFLFPPKKVFEHRRLDDRAARGRKVGASSRSGVLFSVVKSFLSLNPSYISRL